MNSEEIKQQGDEMVERFLKILFESQIFYKRSHFSTATRCAIRSCEDTIEILNEWGLLSARLEIDHQKKIIEYLKTKLNG